MAALKPLIMAVIKPHWLLLSLTGSSHFFFWLAFCLSSQCSLVILGVYPGFVQLSQPLDVNLHLGHPRSRPRVIFEIVALAAGLVLALGAGCFFELVVTLAAGFFETLPMFPSMRAWKAASS